MHLQVDETHTHTHTHTLQSSTSYNTKQAELNPNTHNSYFFLFWGPTGTVKDRDRLSVANRSIYANYIGSLFFSQTFLHSRSLSYLSRARCIISSVAGYLWSMDFCSCVGRFSKKTALSNPFRTHLLQPTSCKDDFVKTRVFFEPGWFTYTLYGGSKLYITAIAAVNFALKFW